MRLPSNVEVLSATPTNDGKYVVLVLKDRSDDSEHIYKMYAGVIPDITEDVLYSGIF
jgi:hypothetical protein